MGFFIENGTGATLDIGDLGLTLEVGEIVDLSLRVEPLTVTNSLETGQELHTLINNGQVIVKDPFDNVTNLSVADALLCAASHNDPHFRVGPGARIGDISDVTLTTPSNGQVLQFDGTDWINGIVTAGSGIPAAPLTSIQYNNAGAFGGDANLVWDDVNDRITIDGATDNTTRAIIQTGTSALDAAH